MHASGVCAGSVTVSGADAVQPARIDTYTKIPSVTHAGRPVYQLAGSTVTYLYFWPSTSGWLIGSSYISGSSGVQSIGSAGAACPDQATGWQVWNGSVWGSGDPVKVVQGAR